MNWIVWFDLLCYYLLFAIGLWLGSNHEKNFFVRKDSKADKTRILLLNFISSIALFAIAGAILLGIKYLLMIT